jgi:hypothetical protein
MGTLTRTDTTKISTTTTASSVQRDPEWEGFKSFVKKMAQVPKEELDEKLAEEKQEKKEKRAG